MSTHANTPKPTPTPELRVKDTIMLTARLSQLLAEEVDLLNAMKVDKIETLQQEKLFITSALDAQRKLVAKHPEVLKALSSQEKSDLQKVVAVFNTILQENYRKLLIAKEINHKIVQAITSVVKEHTMSAVYNGKGYTGSKAYSTLSVTLNKKV